MTSSMSDKAVCGTAPGTPGLLFIMLIIITLFKILLTVMVILDSTNTGQPR